MAAGVRDTKDRIIDALEGVLLESGPGGATLEAVAQRAGVSKGGLLYHYGSKEALYGGLLDRLRRLGVEDAQPDPDCSIIAAYLETSSEAQGSFSSALMASLRLVGQPGIDARSVIVDAIDAWNDILCRTIDDPLIARLVLLVGDGLYLRALLDAERDPSDPHLVPLLERLSGQD